jgi:hypothetical protein
MPSPAEILEGLARIANDAVAYAIAWHVAVALVLVAVLAGWTPSRRTSALLLSAPLASASAFAWFYGNPFNGLLLAAVALATAMAAWGASTRPATPGPSWTLLAGEALVAFAWVYPHFLSDRPLLDYLYASPMGVIPCPSISLSIGFALLAGLPGGRRHAFILVLAGGFYSLFGALRLGVWLDLVLLGGAVALALAAITVERRHAPLAAR